MTVLSIVPIRLPWPLRLQPYTADLISMLHHWHREISGTAIGKTPVRIVLWCPITKMLIKACFLIEPVEQEGVYQTYCISLCSKVFINHFYRMKASPECLNILTYWSKFWVDRLRKTIRKNSNRNILSTDMSNLPLYFTSVAHIDCSAPSGKQHEPLNGVCVIGPATEAPTLQYVIGCCLFYNQALRQLCDP